MRLVTPSLRKIADTCALTVISLICNSRAMCLFDSPVDSNSRTRRWRSVSSPGPVALSALRKAARIPVGMYVPPARMTLSALIRTWLDADLGMNALAPAMMTSCMTFGSPTADTTTMGVAGTSCA